jgi:divalent metal cation (Fe/Co/Zn/Cd) transporter
VVLLQFTPKFHLSKAAAARLAGILLFVLAAVVAGVAAVALYNGRTPESSRLGIAITAAALVLMPVLAMLKRKKARETNNRALAADSAQSATCAYLAAMTLCSLIATRWFNVHWIDSVAALCAVPVLIIEGRRALRGEVCGCC